MNTTVEKKTKENPLVRYDANLHLISTLIGMTKEEMFWAIMEQGYHYLHTQCMGRRSAIRDIKYQHFYWAWWYEQWYQRDSQFITFHCLSTFMDTKARNPEVVRKSYEQFHFKGIDSETTCKAYMYLIENTKPIWNNK